MRREILEYLEKITPEEQELLGGGGDIRRELYTSKKDFIVDSRRLLEKGQLIEIRPHTRFAYFPRHRHDYVEMVYMCRGSTTHILDGRERVVLKEGDLLFLGQAVYHEILPAEKEDLAVNFILLPPFFDRALSMIEEENVLRDFLLSVLREDASRYLHISARGIVPVENLIENMLWTLMARYKGVNTLNETSMGLLLLSLSRFATRIHQDSPAQREQAAAFAVLRYIDEHYRDGTLAEAAKLANLPPYTVSRLLKRRTGCAFKDLIKRRKLEQAAYLLSHTPLTIETILSHIGYANSSFFYRAFREKYGCSPKAFRGSLPGSDRAAAPPKAPGNPIFSVDKTKKP